MSVAPRLKLSEEASSLASCAKSKGEKSKIGILEHHFAKTVVSCFTQHLRNGVVKDAD
jgi:hypothetical protein